MPASNVPKNLFDKPEALSAFVHAAGDSPELLDQMKDYAAFSLRKAAVRDGEIDPVKYQKWVDDHGYALRKFPDVAENFSNAAKAQGALDTALANQKAALTEFQDSAARHFLGDQEPEKAIGKAIANPGQFAKLVAPMRDDPAAFAGMRRATVEYMLNKTLSTAEAGTSGESQIKADALQKFIRDNRLALSTLFNADERASMEAVAGDLQRANRSIVAARMPGTSGTTADTAMLPKGNGSVLAHLIWHAVGTAGGTLVGHPVAGFISSAVVQSLRAARMDSVNKALVEMMLDPKKAAAGIAKVPSEAAETTARSFAQRLRSLTSDETFREADSVGAASANPPSLLKSGQMALARALSAKSDAFSAMKHPEIGPIDFRWGDEKGGISHILESERQEVVDQIPNVIAHGKLGEIYKTASGRERRNIDYGDLRVVLSPTFNDKPGYWVVTAFKKTE